MGESYMMLYSNISCEQKMNRMTEMWKDILGYEGKYYISCLGRLKNSKGVFLRPMKCTNGYLVASLWKNNQQQKILVHRLVACAFLDNPKGYTEVNHIDEDKTNNAVSNLEWCTHRYNMNYGHVREKIKKAKKGKHLTPEHRKKCASAKGRKWMSNGICERLIKESDIPPFLTLGYKIGRLKYV